MKTKRTTLLTFEHAVTADGSDLWLCGEVEEFSVRRRLPQAAPHHRPPGAVWGPTQHPRWVFVDVCLYGFTLLINTMEKKRVSSDSLIGLWFHLIKKTHRERWGGVKAIIKGKLSAGESQYLFSISGQSPVDFTGGVGWECFILILLPLINTSLSPMDDQIR